MGGFPILFGIHCHQPVDNFHHVVDEVINQSYKPFFEKAGEYPFFKFSAHFSGWLLEYIQKHHGDFFSKMADMAKTGQVEFFTGGFYEPVLASIPSADRIQQINKLSEFIKENFDQTPKGLWLTERVWDPSIVKDIVECGIEYVIVDDYHFLVAGFEKDDTYGYFNTEQDGKVLSIFPVDKTLRYIVPFSKPAEIFNYIHEIKNKPKSSAAIIFDDGEKFGTWPKTYDWVYNEGWFESFVNTLNNDDSVFCTTYREFLKDNRPNGLAYLPITSYYEMGEWSLNPHKYQLMKEMKGLLKDNSFGEETDIFVRGATWHNFLVKYPEANLLHKRILYLTKKRTKFADMFLDDFIFRAQCNDVFWHGIFGGIYLPNLRDNAFKYLIMAEKRYEELTGRISPAVENVDIDLDGYEEIILTNKIMKLHFDTKTGGALRSMDIRDVNFSLSNTLTRRKESYHTELLENTDKEKEKGISTIHEMSHEVSDEMKQHLTFDWHQRYSFMDHFVHEMSDEKFEQCSYNEIGDFVNQPFFFEIFPSGLSLKRSGGIYVDNEKYDTSIKKTFELKDNNLFFDNHVETHYDNEILYGIEFNFHFFDYNNILINNNNIADRGTFHDKVLEIKDRTLNKIIKIETNERFRMNYFIVKTVSQSEGGVDLTAQGIALVILFKMNKYININGSFRIGELT